MKKVKDFIFNNSYDLTLVSLVVGAILVWVPIVIKKYFQITLISNKTYIGLHLIVLFIISIPMYISIKKAQIQKSSAKSNWFPFLNK